MISSRIRTIMTPFLTVIPMTTVPRQQGMNHLTNCREGIYAAKTSLMRWQIALQASRRAFISRDQFQYIVVEALMAPSLETYRKEAENH